MAFDHVAHSRWRLPLLSVASGLALLLAALLGGHPLDGAWMLGSMVVFGLGILVAGGRRTGREPRGQQRAERFSRLDVHATALAGLAVILAVNAGFVYEVAQGHAGAPYTWLAALGGATYLTAIVVLRRRG